MPTLVTSQRLQGLDGLRAIAVSAVVLFHAEPDWLPGGFLGVDLFFVISGFLITRQLLAELADRGSLDLLAFYRRRTRRLFPPMLAMLVAVVVGALCCWPDELTTLRGDVPATLGYAANWHLILAHRSYFQAAGRPSPLQHLWSLAIEEQFYLCWPVLLLLATTLRVRRNSAANPARLEATRVALLALAGAVASSGWMWMLAVRGDVPYGSDSSRLYFGTDTHAAGLLVGSALAALVARQRRGNAGVGLLLNVSGVAALLILGWSFVHVSEFSPGLYRGGFLVFAALAAIVVAAATRSGSWLGHLLDAPLLRAIGVRSYGIYLWHWPVTVVTRPGLDLDASPTLILLVRIAVPLLLADLSYRLLEHRPRSCLAARTAQARWRLSLGSLAVGALVAGTLVTGRSSAAAATTPGGSARAFGVPTTATPAATATPLSAPATRPSAVPTPTRQQAIGKVLAVGDSVLLGAAPALHAEVGELSVDAVVGRQARPTLALLDVLRPAPGAVVIDTGNNGVIDPKDLEKTLRSLKNSKVVIVNDNVPRDWQDPNNAIIRAAVRRHSGAVLFDWLTLSEHHPEWFYADGYHVRPVGATAFASGVTAALHRATPIS